MQVDLEKQIQEKSYKDRLLSSADRLRARLYEKYDTESRLVSSVNNSWPVTFTHEMREEHKIYPYGRREVHGTGSILWASPEAVDRTAKWIPQNVGSIEQMERTRAGVAATWEWKEIKKSEPVHEDKGRQFQYEKALLTQLSYSQGRVYMLNPSNGTVWAAEKLDFRIICDPQWEAMYAETLQKMQVRTNVFSPVPRDKIVYVGPHGKPEGYSIPLWCSLLPNVYAQSETGKPHEFEVQADGVRFEYVRRGHTVRGKLYFAPGVIRYNPATVDSFLLLSTQGTLNQFFLETNMNIAVKDIEQHSTPLQWVVEEPKGNEDDFIVWDVPGPGTYMSRRHLIELRAVEAGKRPCTLSNVGGAVAVSLTTVKLGHQRFFSFQGNASQLRINGWGEPECPETMIMVHDHPDRGQPLMLVPGLFFSLVPWGSKNGCINWFHGKFFLLKSMRAVHDSQIDIVKFFFWQ